MSAISPCGNHAIVMHIFTALILVGCGDWMATKYILTPVPKDLQVVADFDAATR
jgi:hypothetical protein